jgi:hypothetical protein
MGEHTASHAGERAGDASREGDQSSGTPPSASTGGHRGATTTPATRSDTVQSARDNAEKAKHPHSENALESSQEKNPVPPDSTRRS